MSDEWGPWIDSYDPSVGMYIQAKIAHDVSGEMKLHEGVVTSETEGMLGMSPKFYGGVDWTLIEWREKKPKGLAILESVLREVERTDEMV